MNASVLARPYQRPEDQTYDTPEPREAPMNHPTAFMVGAQETGAQFYPNQPRTVVPPTELPAGMPARAAQPSAPAHAPSPAATLARGAQPQGQKLPNGWTKERKQEADELNRMGRMHTERLEGRRSKRKAITSYDRMKHQLEVSADAINDLRELKKSYGKDDEHGLAIQRKIMAQLIKAERLHKDLQGHAQELNKRHQVPLGKDGFLADYDAHLDEDDKKYDEEAIEAMAELAERSPSQ